jgi:predicted nucleic-acid-binding protein
MRLVGLDTNVVIRLLVNDDPEQHRAALAFGAGLGKEYEAFLPLIAVLELDWALRAKLGFTRKQASFAIDRLLHTRGLIVEHHDLVVKALQLVNAENADFSDALIAGRAKECGCDKVVTFDRKAAEKIPEMELLQ